MAKIIKGKISDLKQDPRNFNKGSEFGKALIDKSIEKFGAGRGIVADRNGNIIGGNHITQALGENGIENVVFVQTTGKELVVTQRMDIDKNTPEGLALASEMGLADNQTNKINYILDAECLAAEVSDAICEEWGVSNNDYSKGLDVNGMDEDDLDFLEQFDPIGTSKGQQRVVFIFDGAEEAQSWLNKTDSSLPMVKRNMAWQVDLSTQST